MNITLDGKPGDSSQLTEHCRNINGGWYSSPAGLPEELKPYSVLWEGIDPAKMHVNPPPPPVKSKKKSLTPQEEAEATVAAASADGRPCDGC